jgi:hypothetical protein
MGLFGPGSFFATRANATPSLPNITSNSLNHCSDPIPFSYLVYDDSFTTPNRTFSTCASNSPETYFNDLNTWLKVLFADPPMTKTVFTQGAFYANQANLVRAAAVNGYSRMLFTLPGWSVRIFKIDTWAIIVISVVTALHILGLWALAVYAGIHHTWTNTLDAFAVLRLGGSLTDEKDMPRLGRVK